MVAGMNGKYVLTEEGKLYSKIGLPEEIYRDLLIKHGAMPLKKARKLFDKEFNRRVKLMVKGDIYENLDCNPNKIRHKG